MACLTVTEKRLETKNSFVRSLKYGISCMVYIVIIVIYVTSVENDPLLYER
jgi:hypothetical protein